MTTPPPPRLRNVQCLDTRGLHRMAYWEWGAPDNRRVLVCVHGLSRPGRDFDTLARDLCGNYPMSSAAAGRTGSPTRWATRSPTTSPTW